MIFPVRVFSLVALPCTLNAALSCSDGSRACLQQELDEVSLLQLSTRSTLNQQQLVRKLWLGHDLSDDESESISSLVENTIAASSKPSVQSVSPSKLERIHLLGPPDSGTNLLSTSLHLNWPTESFVACHSSRNCDMSLWKHSIGDERELFQWMKKDGDMSKALVLMMVRSPIAQMDSWKNNPYGLRNCFGPLRPLQMADQSCWANTAAGWYDKPLYDKKHSVEFSNAVDVYNKYLQQYNALLRDKRIGHVLLVGYEDLVYTPETTLKRIADAMGWSMPKKLALVESKAKKHGVSKDRDGALSFLAERAWLRGYTTQHLRKVCDLIDESAINGLEEGTHTNKSIPYTFDCDEAKKAPYRKRRPADQAQVSEAPAEVKHEAKLDPVSSRIQLVDESATPQMFAPGVDLSDFQKQSQ